MGEWEKKGRNAEGQDWRFSYVIDKQEIEMVGVPAFHTKGNYKIINEIENLVVLQVFNLQGDGDLNPYRLVLSIDRKEDRITIENRDYKRVL